MNNSNHIIVIGIYRPPSANKKWFEIFDQLLQEVALLGPIVLLGDLNANLMLPYTYPANTLLKSLSLAHLEICEIFPTRITAQSATCLDIIAMASSMECIDYRLDECATSDHFPVIASISVLNVTRPKPIIKRNFKN